jgi:hypothetical protein
MKVSGTRESSVKANSPPLSVNDERERTASCTSFASQKEHSKA